MRPRKRERWSAIKLLADRGLSATEIAATLGIHRVTVSYYLHRYGGDMEVVDGRDDGRDRKADHDRVSEWARRAGNGETLKSIAMDNGVTVSCVSHTLKRYGYPPLRVRNPEYRDD